MLHTGGLLYPQPAWNFLLNDFGTGLTKILLLEIPSGALTHSLFFYVMGKGKTSWPASSYTLFQGEIDNIYCNTIIQLILFLHIRAT